MGADYRTAIDWVIDTHEGGFQKAVSDPGNYYQGQLIGTNWGVSAPVAREHGWTGRMEDMPREWAIQHVYPTYWAGLEGIQSQNMAAKILDMRLSGIRRADRYVQAGLAALGWSLSVDGMIGPQTTDALNRESEARVMPMLVDQQTKLYAASYNANPIGQSWFNVWMRRARDIPSLAVVAAVGSLAGLAVVGLIVWAAVNA